MDTMDTMDTKTLIGLFRGRVELATWNLRLGICDLESAIWNSRFEFPSDDKFFVPFVPFVSFVSGVVVSIVGT